MSFTRSSLFHLSVLCLITFYVLLHISFLRLCIYHVLFRVVATRPCYTSHSSFSYLYYHILSYYISFHMLSSCTIHIPHIHLYCDAPTWHRVSSEGSFFFSSHINFKLVHSYNVKQLTCIIFCSSGLQNIYTSSI